jgi:hypothetical protein
MRNQTLNVKDKPDAITIRLKFMVIFISILLSVTCINAQQAIPASGGNATGSGGTVSYSVGQTFYTTNSGSNGSVAEGVQQPFEISVIIGIKQAEGINLSCSVYPNPTSDLLILKVNNYELSNLMFQLIDMNGKLIETRKVVGNETRIIMSEHVRGTYFLKVNDNRKEVKTFKIIKY